MEVPAGGKRLAEDMRYIERYTPPVVWPAIRWQLGQWHAKEGVGTCGRQEPSAQEDG